MPSRAMAKLAGLAFIMLSNCGESPTAVDPIRDTVLVMSSNWTGQYDIWLRDSDDKLTDLTPSTPLSDLDPAWSPDGQRIAFSSIRDLNNFHVYVMNADGSGVVKLTDTVSSSGSPSWSPNGQQIVFQGDLDLWTANADGTSERRLTFGATANTPAWSPDGQKIAFSCGLGTNPPNREICTINTDGSDTTILTHNTGNEFAPAWSPDGQKIAFFSDRQQAQRWQVFIMNSDGTGETRLTSGLSAAYNPTWTRDGLLIVYVTGTPSTSATQLYAMNPDGTNQVPIPKTAGAATVSFRP